MATPDWLGSPSHNRTTPRQKRTIGLFIEIFPLQAGIEDGESFESHAKVAHATRDLLLNAPPSAGGMFAPTTCSQLHYRDLR